MKSETPNLDYLKSLIDKIKALLDDPQPGLISWSIALGERMEELDRWYHQKK